MKKLIAAAFVLTLLSPTLLAQTDDTKTPVSGNVESKLVDLEKQGVLATRGNDPTFMQKYLADDYMGIGSMGQMTDKPTAIDNLKTGKIKYEKLEVSERKVTQYGPDIAIVRGKVSLRGVYLGQPIDGSYSFSRTWLQRNGAWQVIGFQSTKVQ